MSYKFQTGPALMQGKLVQSGSLEIRDDDAGTLRFSVNTDTGLVSGSNALIQMGAAVFGGTMDVTGAISGAAALSCDGAITGKSLNIQAGGITNAGAIAGATSVDGSGDLTMGTITMTGFSVDADGDTALKSLAVDNSSTIGCDADADLITLDNTSVVFAANATVSGGATTFTSLAGTSLALQSGGITAAGAIAGGTTGTFSSTLSGANVQGTAGTLTSLNLQDGGVTNAGAIAGAGNITSTGVVSGSGFFDLLKDKLRIGGTAVTADGPELNLLDGCTATTTELNYVDVTAGTATVNKAVVLDGSKNIATLGTVGCGAITSTGASSLGSISSVGAVTTTGLLSSSAGAQIVGNTILGGTLAVSGNVTLGDAMGDSLTVNAGSVSYAQVANIGFDNANDGIYFFDATDSTFKRQSWDTIWDTCAGDGITNTNGVLSVDESGGDRISVSSFGDEDKVMSVGINFGTTTLGQNRTATLPASPTVGDVCIVKAPSLAGYTLTVSRNGTQLIDGATTVELESNGGALSVCYVDTNKWKIY